MSQLLHDTQQFIDGTSLCPSIMNRLASRTGCYPIEYAWLLPFPIRLLVYEMTDSHVGWRGTFID